MATANIQRNSTAFSQLALQKANDEKFKFKRRTASRSVLTQERGQSAQDTGAPAAMPAAASLLLLAAATRAHGAFDFGAQLPLGGG